MKRLSLFSFVALLGLAFVIPISSSWSAGTLKVTTPNGGQKWTTGKKYAIKWVKGNAGATVKIQLLKSNKHHKWITKNTKNDGNYIWKITTTVDSGSAYKVKIVSVKNKRVFDKSHKNFTITKTDNDGGSTKSKGVESTSLVQQATAEKEAAKKHRSIAARNVKAVGNAAKTACSKIKNISIGSTIKKSWATTDCSATPQALISPFTNGYSKFYSFTVSSKSTATFHLYTPENCKPVAYPQMVLRKGKTTSGSYKKRVDASCYKSGKLRTVLTAGTYTLEVASALWCKKTCSGYSTTGPFVLKTSCKGDCSTGDSDDDDSGSLNVTKPNGGEKWKSGKKYLIKWDKGNGGTFVRIQLLKSDKHYKWVSKKTKNDGKHPWKVPATVASGSAYKIKITSVKNKKVFDKSNKNFTISKTGSSDSDDDDESSLKVTNPNGSESWEWGKRYAIKWDKAGAGKFVRIFLLKSTGNRYKTISKKTKNDGKYPWKVATAIASGGYKIRVQSVSDSTLNDDSDTNFTIGNTLEVTSPNGGESWDAGSTYSITWDKGNAGGYVKLYLYNSGSLDKTISSYTSNDGSYSWAIPSTQTGSSKYKIRVQSYSNSSIYDESDNNFSIEEESFPSGDYAYLNKHNAYQLGGYTLRWKSKTIQVSGATGSWQSAVNRWPTVNFSHVGSAPALGNGIQIVGYADIGNYCGLANWTYWSNGEMASCKVRINPDLAGCDSEADTVTHEIGHCLGIFKHTTDGGLMDATAAGSSEITSPIRNMISLLYSLSPGTNINSKFRSPSAKRRSKNNKYDPAGTKLYSGSSYFMRNGEVKIVPNW